MLGTYVNVAAVVAGTLAGVSLRSHLKENYRELTVQAIGVAIIAMGVRMFLDARSPVVEVASVASFIFGGLIGELVRLDRAVNALGDYAQKRLARSDGANFQQAFVSTTILFCVGPMTLLGCLQDGLGRGSELLILKSILDGVSSAFFASALGWGVMLSAVTVFVVQGGLTLAAGVLTGLTETDPRLTIITVVGGLMLISLGIRLLELRPIRVANYLPGLLLGPLVIATATHFGWRP